MCARVREKGEERNSETGSNGRRTANDSYCHPQGLFMRYEQSETLYRIHTRIHASCRRTRTSKTKPKKCRKRDRLVKFVLSVRASVPFFICVYSYAIGSRRRKCLRTVCAYTQTHRCIKQSVPRGCRCLRTRRECSRLHAIVAITGKNGGSAIEREAVSFCRASILNASLVSFPRGIVEPPVARTKEPTVLVR